MRRIAIPCLLCALLLAAFAPAGHGSAGVFPNRPSSVWATDGEVDSILVRGDTVYVGGSYSQIAPFTGAAALVTADTGQSTGTFPVIDGGYVNAVTDDGVGGWILGGDFETVDGHPCPGLARVLPDGSFDETWCPSPNAPNPYFAPPVRALARVGSVLYVGGSFTSIGGKARSRVAAFDLESGKLTSWAPRVTGTPVYFGGGGSRVPREVNCITTSGSTVYLGGYFDHVDGLRRPDTAAVDAQSGAVTRWAPRVVGDSYNGVRSIIRLGDVIFIGGEFDGVAGRRRRGVAAVGAQRGEVRSWNARLTGGPEEVLVTSIVAQNDRLYIGGAFRRVQGRARRGLAAISTADAHLLPFDPRLDNVRRDRFPISRLALDGTTLFTVGGFQAAAGEKRKFAASFDTETGNLTTWDPRPDDAPAEVSVSDEGVVLGGDFSGIGGVFRHSLAAIDAQTGRVTGWEPDATGSVEAIAASASTLYVGGQGELAGFDLGTGKRTSFHADVTGGNFPHVAAIAVEGDTVYIGGDFRRANGVGRLRAAALDAATGDVRSWNPRVGGTDEYDPGTVDALVVAKDLVYLGGRVYRVGGVPRIQLAAVDAITGALSEWNPSPKGYVNALAGAGALLFVGGDFDRIAGTPRSALASFETTSGALRPWDPSPTSSGDDLLSVESLAIVDSTVYVGGYFTSIAGAKRNGLAAVDAETGSLDDWDPVPTPAGVLSASQTTIAAAEDDRVTVFVRGVGQPVGVPR